MTSHHEHREDLINMKMAVPPNAAGEEGTRLLMQLMRVWCAHKHSHSQFNILNRQSLLETQKDLKSTGSWSCGLPATARTSRT